MIRGGHRRCPFINRKKRAHNHTLVGGKRYLGTGEEAGAIKKTSRKLDHSAGGHWGGGEESVWSKYEGEDKLEALKISGGGKEQGLGRSKSMQSWKTGVFVRVGKSRGQESGGLLGEMNSQIGVD